VLILVLKTTLTTIATHTSKRHPTRHIGGGYQFVRKGHTVRPVCHTPQ
jgi:hypothetical protein